MTFTNNLFQQYSMAASYDRFARKNLRALKETLTVYRIPQSEWSNVGDMVLRVAHYMGRTNRPLKIHKLNTNSRFSIGSHVLMNLYENYVERLNTMRADHE